MPVERCPSGVVSLNLHQATLPLSVIQTDVWITHLDEADSPALLARYRALMSSDELARADRFLVEHARTQHIVTRALVRTVLSHYEPTSAQDWRFELNSHGRPSIAPNDGASPPSLRFNLSHTDKLVACAVTRDAEIGVDVEAVDRRVLHRSEIAERHFASDEVRELLALPQALQAERFFEYWTLKEAYIKARGKGLAIPLGGFAYRLQHPGSVALSTAPALDDDAARWALWLYRPSSRHMLALCREHRGLNLEAPRVRVVVPLVSSREIDLQPHRRSTGAAG